MKVCQICAVDFTLKKFLLPLVDAMSNEGWSVTSVCSDGHLISGMRADGYIIDTIPIARSINPFLATRSLFLLTQYLIANSFDVVHVHTPVASIIGRIAAKLAGTPCIIYTAHGFYFHEFMPFLKRVFFIQIERFCGRFTNLLFCQSSEDYSTAIKEGIANPDQVLHIGNGVDLTRFKPLPPAYSSHIRYSLGIPSDAFVVGLIARQVQEKGIVEFLESVTFLAKRYPKLYVLLVGDRLNSDHNNNISDQLSIAKRTLGDRLLSLGSRDDIPQLISILDLFCLPSWREGMPRTIIEAMAMSKPVVATDIRGSRELVVHKQTGYLIPVRSPSGLISAIELFVNNPSLCYSYGRAGYLRACNLYSEASVLALQISKIKDFFQTKQA